MLSKDMLTIFKDKDKLYAIYDIYNDFLNIAKKDDRSLNFLLEELSHELALLNVDSLKINKVDMAFLGILSSETEHKNMPLLIKLLMTIKYLFTNKRDILRHSELYNQLSKQVGGTTVNYNSDEYSFSKLRLMLKAIDNEPQFLQKLIYQVDVLDVYKLAVINIWEILRNIKSVEKKKQLARLFKTEEMCCVLYVLFNKIYTMDFTNNFRVQFKESDVNDILSVLIMMLLKDFSEYVEDIVIENTMEMSYLELMGENSILKEQYKQLIRENYDKNSVIEKANREIIAEEHLETDKQNNAYEIDFGLTLQQKKDLLSTSKFLLLKSKDIKIVDVMKSVRIENIESISSDILNDNYDAIIVLTKGVAHSDVYRLKSLCNMTKLIYTERTNRKLIIEDIYNQF